MSTYDRGYIMFEWDLFSLELKTLLFFLLLSGDVSDVIVNVVTSMLYLCCLSAFWFTECIIGSVLQHKK